jgi:hypothetical protein
MKQLRVPASEKVVFFGTFFVGQIWPILGQILTISTPREGGYPPPTRGVIMDIADPNPSGCRRIRNSEIRSPVSTRFSDIFGPMSNKNGTFCHTFLRCCLQVEEMSLFCDSGPPKPGPGTPPGPDSGSRGRFRTFLGTFLGTFLTKLGTPPGGSRDPFRTPKFVKIWHFFPLFWAKLHLSPCGVFRALWGSVWRPSGGLRTSCGVKK